MPSEADVILAQGLKFNAAPFFFTFNPGVNEHVCMPYETLTCKECVSDDIKAVKY